MIGLRFQHIHSVLDDVDENAMTPDPAVAGSSGGGARSRGDGGEVVGPRH
jgi:hypothetical protein